MIIIIGLVILIAAVVAGVAVVLRQRRQRACADPSFAVFGHHVTGTIGTLFLYGIVLGAVGLFGLSLLLAGVHRSSRRGSAARRGVRTPSRAARRPPSARTATT